MRQMQALRTAYLRMLRKVLRLSTGQPITNAKIFDFADSVDVRINLALGRLRYARKVFTVGPKFLQHRVHLEFCAQLTHDSTAWQRTFNG